MNKKMVLKKKYRKGLFIMKKLLKIGVRITIVILAILLIKDRINTVNTQNKAREDQVMNAYIECLKDNWTQRDYCARKVSNTDYRILDQKIEKYGYKYKQVGYNLYLVDVNK